MKKLKDIPKHEKCINCGECCGIVVISKKEKKEIQDFVDKHKPVFNANHTVFQCKFRTLGKCQIYEVRPTLCRLFGVTKGMQCKNGNSQEIDGLQFMKGYRAVGTLNEQITCK